MKLISVHKKVRSTIHRDTNIGIRFVTLFDTRVRMYHNLQDNVHLQVDRQVASNIRSELFKIL